MALTSSAAYYKKALPLAKNPEERVETIYMLAYCYYMLNDESNYIDWAGKYEHMQNTELYRIEACTMTPLYDEPDTLKDRWNQYY